MYDNPRVSKESRLLNAYHKQIEAAVPTRHKLCPLPCYLISTAVLNTAIELSGDKRLQRVSFMPFNEELSYIVSLDRERLLSSLEECIKNAKAAQGLN